MLFLSCGKTRRGRNFFFFPKQICCQSQSTGVTRCSEAGPVNACKTQSARPDCNYAGTNMLFKMSHYELMLHCQSPVCFCLTALDSLQKVWLILGRRAMTGGLSEQVDAAHWWDEIYTDAPVNTERSPSLQIQVLFSELICGFYHSLVLLALHAAFPMLWVVVWSQLVSRSAGCSVNSWLNLSVQRL